MNNCKSKALPLIMIVLCLFSLSGLGQFRANMLFTLSGKEKEFIVFSDENRYRYEFVEDGQKGAVIVLQETNEVFVLMLQQNIAFRTAPTSYMSMGTDPLKLYEYQVNQGASEKVISKEKINGYDCIKKELYGENDQLLYTMWYSEEYKFPVKIVSHIDVAGTTSMELKDIEPWTPDDASFVIPDGYTVMDQ
jgi:outer membrane lipoprotein-sorting protein